MPAVYLQDKEFRKPTCPQGHYKPKVGVDAVSRSCCQCRNERARERRENIKSDGPPEYQWPTQIKEVREYLGLSKESFAKCLGVSNSAVFYWEREAHRMRSATVKEIVPKLSAMLIYRKEQIRNEHAARADQDRHELGPRGRKRIVADTAKQDHDSPATVSHF